MPVGEFLSSGYFEKTSPSIFGVVCCEDMVPSGRCILISAVTPLRKYPMFPRIEISALGVFEIFTVGIFSIVGVDV